MEEYLKEQIDQHKDLKEIYYNKYTRAVKIETRNKLYIVYKIHNEAVNILQKALDVYNLVEVK